MRQVPQQPVVKYEPTRDRHRYADQTAVANAIMALRRDRNFYNSDLLAALLKEIPNFIDNAAQIDGRTKQGKALTELMDTLKSAEYQVREYFKTYRPEA